MLDVKRLAEYIGMSPQWIYNNKSKLPHVNINNKPLFRQSEIDRWLESCRVQTSNTPIELNVSKGKDHKNEIQTTGFNQQRR
jgi:predicted DNA-binding transcriptional regulator AlpA